MRLRDRDRSVEAAEESAAATAPRQVSLRVPAPVVGAAGERPPVRRHAPTPMTVLGVSSLGVFIAFVDATIVNIAFPDIALSFPDASLSGLSWVLNAYNIVFAAFLVAAGRLADLLGRRRIFLAGLLVFTLSSALCAIAPSPGFLIAARVIQALGAALMVPSSLGLVLEAFPLDRRAHAVALLTAIGALAAGIGPSLGGFLIELSDWRLVFLVNVPIGIAAYVLSRKHLVESRAPGRRRVPDLLGSVMFAGAIATLVLGVVQGEEWGWTDWRVLASFGSAIALTLAFAQRCTWHRAPVLDLTLLRIRTFSTANSMTVVASAGFYGYTLINVLFLTRVWDYSILEAGLALTPGPFVAAAVAGPSSKLAEKHGHRVVLFVGGLVWATAVMWLVTQVGMQPAFVAEWLPATILLGIGAGITFPNLSGAAIASAPGESFATATGLNSVARQVGAALGVALVVAILGTPTAATAADAFDDAWTFGASCFVLTALGCLLLARLEVGGAGSISLPSAARGLFQAAGEAAEETVHEAPRTHQTVEITAPAALRPETPEQFLSSVPLLADLPAPMRAMLAEQSRPLHVSAGDWLFRKGDPGDAMYVVRAGRLEVTVDGPDGPTVRELGRGAALGELSLLTESPRSASVRAARESDLITIGRDDFQRLIHESPELPLALTRVLAEQLKASRPIAPSVRPLASTIAIVALDKAVPHQEIAARLALSLAAHHRVVRLDGSEAAAPMPGFTPAVAYGPLLDRAEAAGDQVLLSGGLLADGEPWTDFCLQQADRVLVIGSGAEQPDPDETPRPELRGCDLIAYDVAMGSGALARVAEALDPIETHLVRSGDAMGGDLARLARRLTGTSLGIVLSGGGARAFSHIGVLEELLAAGVVIDRVAGVSMGSYVGAMFAMGMDAEEMDAHCFDEWVRRRPLGDMTMPKHSLIKGDRVRAMLRRVYGDAAIEELPRSFVSGCADLRTGELVLARWGSLEHHVGLSVCMPVLAPVQVEDRRLLIDGSLVDNLPIEPMAALGEGPLIAVDVKATFERPAGNGKGANGTAPPREERAPSLGETLTRLLLLASSNTSDAARKHAALTIKPRNDGMGLLEFHQIDRAREAGRVAAREALENTPEVLFGRAAR